MGKSDFYKKTISVTVISSKKYLQAFQLVLIPHDGFIINILCVTYLKLLYIHTNIFLIIFKGNEKTPNPSVSMMII